MLVVVGLCDAIMWSHSNWVHDMRFVELHVIADSWTASAEKLGQR